MNLATSVSSLSILFLLIAFTMRVRFEICAELFKNFFANADVSLNTFSRFWIKAFPLALSCNEFANSAVLSLASPPPNNNLKGFQVSRKIVSRRLIVLSATCISRAVFVACKTSFISFPTFFVSDAAELLNWFSFLLIKLTSAWAIPLS